MSQKTLKQFYDEHQGKVSDKWSLYLTEYERVFSDYRNKPIRMLEIGIQNGGSLEIWGDYFDKAERLLGCDINPDCEKLEYNDERIDVTIGDANDPEIYNTIINKSAEFDIVIDDGSHTSSDIIKSFCLYFPKLIEGGVFVAEDVQCSYWQGWDGGIHNPYSSITFFKHLADVINFEHWGVAKSRADILRGLLDKYECKIDEETLSKIHSIEFINSFCVIRKSDPAKNGIGNRVISGTEELVVEGHTGFNGTPYDLANSFPSIADQSQNPWSLITIPPGERVEQLEQTAHDNEGQINALSEEVSIRDQQIEEFEQSVVSWEGQIKEIEQSVANRDFQILDLEQSLASRDVQIAELTGVISQMRISLSWIVTYPIRIIGSLMIRIPKALFKAFLMLTGLIFPHFLRKLWKPSVEVDPSGSLKDIRYHIDVPTKIFHITANAPSIFVSGWAVDLKTGESPDIKVVIGGISSLVSHIPRGDVQAALADVCLCHLDTGFLAREVKLPTGFNRVCVYIKGDDGAWVPVLRMLAFKLPDLFSKKKYRESTYEQWYEQEDINLSAELPELNHHMEVMLHKPSFAIIIDARDGVKNLAPSMQSLDDQIYPYAELSIVTQPGEKLPNDIDAKVRQLHSLSVEGISSDFVAVINSGELLAKNALYEFASVVNQYPDRKMVYGDEDCINASQKRDAPFYKPDWSPDYLETFNYIGFTACYHVKVLKDCPEFSSRYDLVLRYTEKSKNISHINKILGHRIKVKLENKALDAQAKSDVMALQGRLERTGRQGVVREHEQYRGCYDVELKLSDEPLVSIVIPTAAKTIEMKDRKIDLLINVIEQIVDRSTYRNFEIIVVDNGDLTDDHQRFLSKHNCKTITFTDPVFNIPKKLNLGASIAKGELLLLMNDDIEILTPSWIERMMEHFEKDHVGVVGAKLLYPDGTTQHVGVVHNHGNPDHLRRKYPGDEAGYFYSTCGVRNYTGVTGAVMMARKKVYDEVGGYSEELAVSYNDVDFCLKVSELGYSIVYAPKVTLTHMESASRVASAEPSEVTWYHTRWSAKNVKDRYYNEDFLSIIPSTYHPHINQRML